MNVNLNFYNASPPLLVYTIHVILALYRIQIFEIRLVKCWDSEIAGAIICILFYIFRLYRPAGFGRIYEVNPAGAGFVKNSGFAGAGVEIRYTSI